MAGPEPSREDLQAALHARRELGLEYEDAVLDSFLERLDRSIAARVDARLAEHTRQRGGGQGATAEGGGGNEGLVLGLVSLGAGIPISGIAGGTSGATGLIVAWAGIAAVNAAHAWGRSRRR